MLFQEPLIVKFSCAENNQPLQCRSLHTRCVIATSEPVLNVMKNFVRKSFQAIRKIVPPPIRYGLAYLFCMHAHNYVHNRLRSIFTIHPLIQKDMPISRYEPVGVGSLGLHDGPSGDKIDTLVHFP